MKRLALGLSFAALVQVPSGPMSQTAIVYETVRIQFACVNTEHMPIAHVQSNDHMPVVAPDMSKVEHMPVAILKPCYLADSTGLPATP